MSYAKGRKKLTVKTDEGADEWLTTYADAITLLLCFFIILISVSEPNTEKFEAFTEGIASGFVQDMIELPFKTVHEDFQMIIDDNAVYMDVAAEFTDEGVQLDMGGSALFESGSATFKKEAVPLLEQVALAIIEMELDEFRIEVEGHTDDVPTKSKIYPSNWELSSARAARVVRFLIEQGLPPETMQATGYADSQPAVPNLDAQGNPIPENRKRNRRVLIHVKRVLG
jgi:chemotaxis protein MotB